MTAVNFDGELYMRNGKRLRLVTKLPDGKAIVQTAKGKLHMVEPDGSAGGKPFATNESKRRAERPQRHLLQPGQEIWILRRTRKIVPARVVELSGPFRRPRYIANGGSKVEWLVNPYFTSIVELRAFAQSLLDTYPA